MTKWLLIWVLGGQVAGASLPDGQQYDSREACDAAAATIKKLGGVRLGNATMTVDADCIEIQVTAPGSLSPPRSESSGPTP